METDALLLKWEEVYKKGLLSFWILLLLNERPSYPFEMRPLIPPVSPFPPVSHGYSIF